LRKLWHCKIQILVEKSEFLQLHTFAISTKLVLADCIQGHSKQEDVDTPTWPESQNNPDTAEHHYPALQETEVQRVLHRCKLEGLCTFRYSSVSTFRLELLGKKVKISLLQAVEALRVARGRGSHIN
jgi:hypothetical protein